jgi:hypothetical protein
MAAFLKESITVIRQPGPRPSPAVASRATTLLPRGLPRAMLLAGLVLACAGAGAAPSTFGPVIGSALLCRSHLDNAYFHEYLTQFFGPAYKRESGAYWFRTEASLWGAQVKEVMVSDDTSEVVFVAAILEVKPDELEKSVRAASGIAYRAMDASRYPLRKSIPGSTIAYANDKSKIYCAKFKPQPPLR